MWRMRREGAGLEAREERGWRVAAGTKPAARLPQSDLVPPVDGREAGRPLNTSKVAIRDSPPTDAPPPLPVRRNTGGFH